MREQIVSTRPDHHGRQVVDVVVDRGYHPDTIHARTGVPIRLIFHREDDDACFERVVFSSPRMDRHLSASDVTIVDLPGQAPGEVRFTCGMGRFRGRIEVIDGGTDSAIAAIRRQVGRIGPPMAAAIVLWFYSVPLIALLAVVALDARAALLVAAAALALSVIGSLWAFDRSAPTT